MKKKIIAAILSCCMLLGTCGVVYAEESPNDVYVEYTEGDLSDINVEYEEGTSRDINEEDESEVSDTTDVYGTEVDDIIQVDEYGNATIVDPSQIESGVVDVPMVARYSDSARVVNFRADAEGEAIPTNTYVSYTEYKSGNSGYINGIGGADAAYLGTENGKVKFMMSGVIGLVDESAVQVVSINNVKSYSNYYANGTNLIHSISSNLASTAKSNINVGKQPSYLTTGTTYYSYDGHYFYTDYDVMLSDYKSDTRSHAVNGNNPYYNYFQYLPLRSATRYSGTELTKMINDKINAYQKEGSKLYDLGEAFVENQNTYGTNAILVASIGAIESGWGVSAISQAKNNLFGWNAVDATPGESAAYFESPQACVEEYTGIHLSQKYLKAGSYAYHGAFLGDKASGMNVSYASDPYWGEKIAGIAWSLDGSNGSKDQYQYKLGIKDTVTYSHTDLNVRKEASTSSPVIYQTGNNSNYSVIILGESNGFYKIQSDSVLNASRTAAESGIGNYNASKMYVYVKNDYISVVNNGLGGNSNTIIGEEQGGSNDKEEVKVELPYADVSENDWYYDSVSEMYKKGIMTGLSESLFGPAELLSRAHFATMIYRMEGNPSVTYKNCYYDIANGIWYTNPIIWCNKSGVITGYENGSFGPADAITREQVALILYRYATYKGYDSKTRNNLSTYPDASKVSGFAKEAVQWAVGSGIISGKNNGTILDPQGNASRAECATMIVRFNKLYNK